MKTGQIMYCVFALLLGMLLANMLQNVCGCNVVEGNRAKGNRAELTIADSGSYAAKGGLYTPEDAVDINVQSYGGGRNDPNTVDIYDAIDGDYGDESGYKDIKSATLAQGASLAFGGDVKSKGFKFTSVDNSQGGDGGHHRGHHRGHRRR